MSLLEEPECEEKQADVDKKKFEGGNHEGTKAGGVAMDILEVLPVDVLGFFGAKDLETIS